MDSLSNRGLNDSFLMEFRSFSDQFTFKHLVYNLPNFYLKISL